MKLKNYCLYRKMCGEEAQSVFRESKLAIIRRSKLCALKCLSESLVVPYRINPYIINPNSQILKFSLSDQTREILFQSSLKTKPLYTDKTYRQYDKFNGQSIYYNCHGKEIDLFNFELNEELLDYLNSQILDIESLDLQNYGELLQAQYLDMSLQDLTTDNSLMEDEFYIQLPLDLAVIALNYQKIPRGGINKSIKARYISKDFNLLERLNEFSLPITLAIKLKNLPEQTKLKLATINDGTYAVDSNLIDTLNFIIESIRLIDYIPERNKHRLSNSNKKPVSLFDVLKEELPVHQTVKREESDLTREKIVSILESSELSEVFTKMLLNTDPTLFKGDYMHGLYHAHKVCLFAFVLSNLLKFTEDETEILIYASLLHDIGRKDSIEDNIHGRLGAEMIDDFAIYINNQKKRNIVKFLIECHDLELDEELLAEKIQKYDIIDTISTLRMLTVLKDSDALDRTRFTIYGNARAALNTDFLINQISHQLIAFSQDLNYGFEKASINLGKEKSLQLTN